MNTHQRAASQGLVCLMPACFARPHGARPLCRMHSIAVDVGVITIFLVAAGVVIAAIIHFGEVHL